MREGLRLVTAVGASAIVLTACTKESSGQWEPNPAKPSVQASDSLRPSPSPTAISESPTPSSTQTLEDLRNQAAQKIIDFYNERGPFKDQYLLKEVTAMNLNQNPNQLTSACVQYNYSGFFTPDQTLGNDTRTFSIRFNDKQSQVTEMGENQSCVIDESQSFTPQQILTPEPPKINDAKTKITTYYDNQGEWAGQYVMADINAVDLKLPAGKFVRACVIYDYALPETPTVEAGTDQRDFVFKFDPNQKNWNATGMGPSGCE